MIIPDSYDIPAIIQGTNYDYTFIIQSDDEAETPKDLEGCTITLTLTNAEDGTTYTFTDGSGLTITNSTGTILFQSDDSVNVNYPIAEYIYRLKIVETNTEVNRYLEGKVNVRE